MSMSTQFFISNQGQASVIKVAYIFIVFRDQNCLMVAQQFDQVTNICQEHSVFQDSKPIFITTDFKILPKIILKQLKFGALSALQLFYAYYKGKTPLFFNLQLLLLLNEKGLSPKSYLAICHPRATVAYIKKLNVVQWQTKVQILLMNVLLNGCIFALRKRSAPLPPEGTVNVHTWHHSKFTDVLTKMVLWHH